MRHSISVLVLGILEREGRSMPLREREWRLLSRERKLLSLREVWRPLEVGVGMEGHSRIERCRS